MSKIEKICRVIDGSHCMGADGLGDYHAARKVRSACLKHEWIDKYRAIQSALKNHNVGVYANVDANTVRILNYSTKAEITL